jgi:hypothetical protein
MQPWSQPLLWKGGTSGDPHWSNVVLLMGFEGANGSTGAPGMTDESPSAHGNATVVGSSVIDTSQFKFGASSLKLVAASSGNIHFNNSADWNLGSGQFTIEAWVQFNTRTAAIHFIVADYAGAGSLGWYLGVDAAGNLSWTVSTTGSNTFNDITGTWSPTNGTWYHVAVDYDGAKYRGYINGAMVGSSTTARTIFNPGNLLAIGSNSINTGLWLDGWVDEIRITKGVARYATDTSFSVPTAAFPRHA